MQKHIDPKNIKALALDLDGTTLMPDTTLGVRTRKALAACMDRGIQIILCTGRAAAAAERFRLAIGMEGPMVYYNGAEVVDMPEGRVLSAALLNIEAVDFCIDISRSTGVYVQAFFPGPDYPHTPWNILIAEQRSAETEMYLNHTGIQAEIGDLKKAVAQNRRGCIKCMFLGKPEALEIIRSLLMDRFGGSVYIACSHKNFLEILNTDASKGTGLHKALEFRGLKPADIIAAGDDENDIPMFGVAGFSLAPANAKESVLQAADRVIGSNADEGLAEFLEHFFLTIHKT